MLNTAPVHPADIRDVTVVVRVSNHSDTLGACLDSLLKQSIGTARMHIIAVDDGSTDDSGSLMVRFAHDHPLFVRAGQQPRGLGPATARNWALSQVATRYVIFLEGSDRLAPDALEQLVGAADKNESDVVLGKLESSGRHSVATSMFRRSRASVDLYGSRVYWSLTPDKLFRTSLLRRRALEFPSDMHIGDDMAFTAAAYAGADNISVLADSTCVIKGPSPAASVRLSERVQLAARMMQLVSTLAPAGAQRDHLLSRHLEAELGKATGILLLAQESRAERERAMWAAQEVLRAHGTPGALALLPRPLAVRLSLLSSGRFAEAERMAEYEADKEKPAPRKTVEGGRVFTTLPFFRDPETALPDEIFEITDRMTVSHQLTSVQWTGSILSLEGFAFFEQLSTRDRATKVVLRERHSGQEERFSVTARRDEKLVNSKGKPRAMGRFSARVNLRQTSSGWPVPAGVWDVFLAVSFEGVTKEVRLGRERSAAVDITSRSPVVVAPAQGSAQLELVATPVYSESGDLSIEMAERLPLPTGR
ncbi:glycosyltransferase [Streptomyces sp. NBC_01217]|uniref:glycosyltransferase n=1 Tax=Streptomyces sp. NBC_01217 TaxID=2903779 RepID=UPI002E154A45|nr:glycosyltransferase [Streptomyces sp. NBC_01217]